MMLARLPAIYFKSVQGKRLQSNMHAFIVRIWDEAFDSDDTLSNWRGIIEYVGKDRRLYFYELQAIPRFIQEQTKLETRNFHWWQSLWTWIQDEIKRKRGKAERHASNRN